MTQGDSDAPHPHASPELPPPFNLTLYRFETDVRANKNAHISDKAGTVVLTYRRFASIVGIVAALVAGIVSAAAIAGAVFFIAEQRYVAAVATLVLAAGFSGVIGLLVPATRVTLYAGGQPALRIVQRAGLPFPRVSFLVRSADGRTIAVLTKSAFARLGRNRWSISAPAEQRGAGHAVEESLPRALVRKVAGKFSRAGEANIRIFHQSMPAGVIVRRPDSNGQVDYLEVTNGSTLDRRAAIALATLVFGAEP